MDKLFISVIILGFYVSTIQQLSIDPLENSLDERPLTRSKRQPGSISQEKCKEYSKLIQVKKQPPTLSLIDEEFQKDECGHKIVELIVGGKPASLKEFPHMAAIGYIKRKDIVWYCGGSLISENFVLTAAHCIQTRLYGSPKLVKLGVIDLLSNDTSTFQQFEIVETISHPDYNKLSYYHDIGLLKLAKAATLGPYVIPACLYYQQSSEFNSHKKAIATGFGQTEFKGELSNNLLKVTLDLIDYSTCNRSHQISRKLLKGVLEEVQICAGSLDIDVDRDTCQGDSGGPLQIYHANDDIYCMYDIIGVTSSGSGCHGAPGIYTRVSHYVKWIEDVVWPH